MIKETCGALITLLKTIEPNTAISFGRVLEIKTLPSLVIEGPTLAEIRRMRSQAKLSGKNLTEKTYVKEDAPRWYDLTFNVTMAADKFADLLNRTEALSRLVQSSGLLHVTQDTTGRVRDYAWDWLSLPSPAGSPNYSGVYSAGGRLIIYAVEAYSGVQEDGPLITSIELNFEGDTKTITDS